MQTIAARKWQIVLICVGLFFGLVVYFGFGFPQHLLARSKADSFELAQAGYLLNDLKWLHPQSDPAGFVSRYFPDPISEEDRQTYHVELGRVAFRNSLLLGGFAAREGLTCATCHPGGQRNDAFFISGLSAEAGTIDTTTSVFSKVLGDNRFNPVAIPSLIDVAKTAPYGQKENFSTLDDFVRHVIVDEFAGEQPSAVIFEALLAYLNALDSDLSKPSEPLRVRHSMDDLKRSLDVLEETVKRDDKQLIFFIVHGMRQDLGRVAERYRGPDCLAIRTDLSEASEILRLFRVQIDANEGMAAEATLFRFRDYLEGLNSRLEQFEPQSLYLESNLREQLSR